MIDAFHERMHDPARPHITFGVQEALVYMDPWYVWGAMFVVWIIGLVCIPFVLRPNPLTDTATRDQTTIGFYSRVTMVLFAFFEAVYLFLLAVGVSMRGPQWAFYWPSEPWDGRDATPRNTNLSEFVWRDMLGKDLPGDVILRESVGLVLLALFFIAGLFVSRRLARMHESMSGWKWTAYVFLLQLAALLPLKMILRWTVGLRYFVALDGFNV